MNKTKCIMLLVIPIALSGCTPPPQFRQNSVEVKKREMQSLAEGEQFSEPQLKDVGSFLTALYGTPDAPTFPKLAEDELPEEMLVQPANLVAAAGPVSSAKDGTAHGLYREHCVHCHGISGDGAGPTAAFMNPYPRDFRLGKFKYKSTPLNVPPTHDDLRRVLVNGLPGTSMPAFRRLKDEEIDALVDYVKYLTIRGLTERQLLLVLSEDPDPTLDLIATEAQMEAAEVAIEEAIANDEEEPFPPLFAPIDALEELVIPTIENWLVAEESVTETPERPAQLEVGHSERGEWIERGRELYFGVGACAQCHGNLGLGDGQVDDFDDWTKDWMKELGIAPDDSDKIREFVNLGAMPPRNLIPRNLRLGSFRGGQRPVDLYLRIKNGIEGTPMPAAAVTLTSDDIWCLVEYIRQLKTEAISLPEQDNPINQRAPR